MLELVNLLKRGKLSSGALRAIVFEPGSKMDQFFEALLQNEVKTDAEAIVLLYGSEKETAKYTSLKNKLKERIIDSVFLLDFSEAGYSNRQQAYFECNKKWAAAMVLLSKNAKTAGIDMLEQLLRHTLHFEFTELTLSILYQLRLQYGTVMGDAKKYEHYRNLYSRYQATWMAENDAEELYTDLIGSYANSKSTKAELSAKAADYHGRIKHHLAANNSFRLHLCGRLLEVNIHSSVSAHAETARLCEEAIAFFDQKPYESNLPLQVFYYHLIVCCIQLRDFERGKTIITKNQALYEAGSFNWFKLQELFFLLSTHTRNYHEAFEVCERVLKHPRLPHQPSQIQEMWKVYEAYVYYLIQVGKVQGRPGTKFKPGKFLNEIPVFSKDKRGMNIPILVAQILFLLFDKNYHQSVDRIEAIDKYCGRYLKQNDTFRSNSFIKMLLQIPAGAFHREAVARKAQKHLEQLRSVPLEIANQAYEIEIIPYEDLWEMTLASLQLQIVKPGKRNDQA